MSLSSIVTDVKHVLADLPTIRTALVAGLAAVGSLLVLLPHVGVDSVAVTGVITAAVAVLGSPKFIQILNDIASAVTPKPVKSVFRRR